MPLDIPETDVLRRRIPQLYAAFAATMGGATFGMVLGWSAPAIELLKKDASYTDEELSWVAGIPPLGALVSMMLMAVTLDRFGRKVVMLALVPPFVIGWMLLAFFRSIPVLLVGRFITGFCGAGYCTAAPVYTGEIAEKQIRGALGVFYQLMLTLGILYVYVVGNFSDLKWLSLCCGIVPMVFFVLFCGAPESPVYLLENDRFEEAVHSLQWLRGSKENIQSELRDMEEMVNESHAHLGSLKHMMSTRAAVKGLWTQMGLLFFQPLSGQNIIIFYAVTIFMTAGTKMDPNVASIILAVVQVLATAFSALLVDRAGRRVLLILSYSGMGVCLVTVGSFFFMRDRDPLLTRDICWLPLVIISIYLVLFSLGCGPLSWAMIGILYVYVVGTFSDLKWLSLCCGIVPMGFFVLFCGVPESPVYLLEKDRLEEAVHSLQWLRGPKENIESELHDMEEMVNESHAHVGSLRHMMSTRAAVKGLLTQLGLLFFQPLSGQNIIIFYAVTIFMTAGTEMDPNVVSIILAVVQVLSTALSALLVDRAGRRVLLILSYGGMGVCLVTVGAFFFMRDRDPLSTTDIGWLPIVIISVYLVLFSLGCGPLSWAMIGELLPQEIKAICSAICAATNAVVTFVVSKTYLNLEAALTTAGTFWLYASFNFVAALWIFVFVIETKGKTLEEIQKELAGL